MTVAETKGAARAAEEAAREAARVAAAEEAAAFATERSLASTDAALPIPFNEIVLPLEPLLFASSAPWPFGLFFEFICSRAPCS